VPFSLSQASRNLQGGGLDTAAFRDSRLVTYYIFTIADFAVLEAVVSAGIVWASGDGISTRWLLMLDLFFYILFAGFPAG